MHPLIWFAAGLGLWFGFRLLTKEESAEPGPVPARIEPLVRAGMRVGLIGDSLGQGLAKPLAEFAQLANVELVSVVEQSTTIRSWRKNLEQKIAGTPLVDKVDLWLVCLGTNDALWPDPTQEQPDLVELLAKLDGLERKPQDTWVVWIEPMPSPKTPNMDVVIDMVEKEPVRLLAPPDNGYERTSDQIHATGRGYSEWAKHIWSILTKSQ